MDLGSLPEPSLDVLAAFVAARESKRGLLVGLVLLFIGPWVIGGVLLFWLARYAPSRDPARSAPGKRQ
ncbi:hypothetical protein [Cystobacter fuscus]|uniref:hypothetical protein n=1 Tax=Cystobacter fuscus TaxID=43 RepID=UPI002B32012D|nr:hypothetical protein F0U63_07675 [Cystobacter fuscus]